MAAGGGGGDHNPFYADKSRPKYERHLSRDDVGNQARVLLSQFIHDRLQADHSPARLSTNEFVQPGTPTGPPVEHLHDVAIALRSIGDELDKDEGLQRLIDQIPSDASQQVFINVARELFADSIFNWGRVVTLFYFAYKMVAKVLKRSFNQLELIREIVEWVVTFIRQYVATWIIERGGWTAIQEYFGTPSTQMLAILLSGVVVSALFVFRKQL